MKKIRILHITDFHLNKDTRKDWNLFLKDALIKRLKEENLKKQIDLVCFTGDALDKGGVDFENTVKGFEIFQIEVITPILESLNLNKDSFFFVPGNHDIDRLKDSIIIENGLNSTLTDRKSIGDYIDVTISSKTFEGIKRIQDFKLFESDFYSDVNSLNSKLSVFSSSFKFQKGETNIGLIAFNSSWRSYGKEDKGKLLLGEFHVAEHLRELNDCDIKIGLLHHPLDQLHSAEEEILTNHIKKELNLLLIGHFHRNQSACQIDFNGTMFINMAPSGLDDISSDSRKFANGFSIIDYNKTEGIIDTGYWRYNHEKKSFVINTDYGDDEGRLNVRIPAKETQKRVIEINDVLEVIRSIHYPRMDEHMIEIRNSNGNIKSIKNNYVLPPIVSFNGLDDSEKKEEISLNHILTSNFNTILFGNGESGKTILLYRLVYEFVEEFSNLNKIPVYMDFDSLGNKEIITVIKEYLQCSTSTANYLIDNNKIILLIDNLNFKKYELYKDRFNRLSNFFIEQKGKTLIIASSENDLNSIAPIEFVNSHYDIPFRELFIRNLGAKEIKSIMRLWIPDKDSLDIENKLEEMIRNFQSFALPSTAMSVSLFLWSTEYHDRKPINHAVLLEIYIEIILQKLDKHNIYRDSFDFTNKLQLLGWLAFKFLDYETEEYSVTYSKYVEFIEDYIKNKVGFSYDSRLIADYLIERKIFTSNNSKIRFTYSCFFHFFLAKRMEFEDEFKSWVIDESRYFKFHKEIDYYTGLVRRDKKLLIEILERFKKGFEKTDFVFNTLEGKWDKHFEVKRKKEETKEEFVPISKNLSIEKVSENRPSQELMDEFIDKRLKSIEDPNKILRKEGKINPEILLILLSNVLRNSEGVEDISLKQDAYNTLVKYCLVWMILYRELLIDYVIKNEKLPPAIPKEANLIQVLQNVPLSVQGGMFKHTGTYKLAPIVLEKIKNDSFGKSFTGSDIEKFLSVALFADIKGQNYDKYLKKLIKSSGNNLVKDYILIKLLNYYYFRTKPESSNEETYLELLFELKISSQNRTKQIKDRFMKQLKDAKLKFLK